MILLAENFQERLISGWSELNLLAGQMIRFSDSTLSDLFYGDILNRKSGVASVKSIQRSATNSEDIIENFLKLTTSCRGSPFTAKLLKIIHLCVQDIENRLEL